jgi:hypothetical protein
LQAAPGMYRRCSRRFARIGENAGDSVRLSNQRVRQVPDDVDTKVVESST